MIGYKLIRGSSGTWMFAGTTPQEVLNTLKVELEGDFSEGGEPDSFELEPFEITQEEIDSMPDFPGW